MITISNGLSLVRAPLALLFWQGSPAIRLGLIFLAMLTDSIDGYVARRNKSATPFGAILDPAMDKFFVFSALGALFLEGRISLFEVSAMLSRDFFLLLFGAVQIVMGRWKSVIFRAIRWGKITTALQFIVLISLSLGFLVPWYIFISFTLMGLFAFLELFESKSHAKT